MLEKKEQARLAREAARNQKRAAADAQKRERERLKQERIAKKKQAEDARATAKLAAQHKKLGLDKKKGTLAPVSPKAGGKKHKPDNQKGGKSGGSKRAPRPTSKPVRASKITRSPKKRR